MKKRYLVLGVLAYLAFLLAMVPANWLAWGLHHVSQGKVLLDQGEGSVWAGSGRLYVTDTKGRAHELGRAQWRVSAARLLLAQLDTRVRWSGEQSDVFANITLTPWRLSLRETRLSASAQLANVFYPPASLFAPQGQLRLRTDALALGRAGLKGSAEVYWDQAGSGLSAVRPLGDYRVDIAARGKEATLKLTTAKGPLELTGQGHWQILGNGQLQLTGTARATARAAELQSLLRVMGRNLGGGRTAFNIRAPMRLRWPLL
jgi:general secretion pathway protein N